MFSKNFFLRFVLPQEGKWLELRCYMVNTLFNIFQFCHRQCTYLHFFLPVLCTLFFPARGFYGKGLTWNKNLAVRVLVFHNHYHITYTSIFFIQWSWDGSINLPWGKNIDCGGNKRSYRRTGDKIIRKMWTASEDQYELNRAWISDNIDQD